MAVIEAHGRRAPSFSARRRHYLARLKRRLSGLRPAALGAMLRPARRADVIECYRAILGRDPETASAVDGHLHGRALLADVVAKLAQSSELRARHLRSNLAFERAREPDYLAKSFREIERVRAHYGHYGFLVEALGARALQTLLGAHAVLHVRSEARSEHRVLLTATHERHEEGELELQLHDGSAVLYVMGVTIVPGEVFALPDRHVLLISRIQGAPGAFLAIRQATKAFGDIQPRSVLLAAAEGLARGLGLRTVLAVASRNQLTGHKAQADAVAKSYDDFLALAGAEPWREDFFRLDLARERRGHTAATRSHVKRAERRRRLKDAIAAGAANEVARWLKPRSPRDRSTAAERAEDHQLLAGRNAAGDGPRLVHVDEDAHVPADAVLLVDDAELQAREAAVEVVEHGLDGFAFRLQPRRALGVGDQLRGDQYADHQSGAATTE